jgi:hypothetical protein
MSHKQADALQRPLTLLLPPCKKKKSFQCHSYSRETDDNESTIIILTVNAQVKRVVYKENIGSELEGR